MRSSARIASFLIVLFFLFFNGLQVYLIIERISETKKKFGAVTTDALLATLADYNKRKSTDSIQLPASAWIAFAPGKIKMTRLDSQTVTMSVPSSSLFADTLEPPFVEGFINSRTPRSVDFKSFDGLFKKALRTREIGAEYLLDTIPIPGRRIERQFIQNTWEQKKKKEYAFATSPMRIPFSSNLMVFAQVKRDPEYIKNDLVWPLLSFALILLIGNAALVFVYTTIRKQKRINEIKTEFINNMTHEMKTPITIASAGLEALEHHIPATGKTGFYLQTSKKQLNLLNDFVDRILDAAVRDVSDFTLKKETIDLRALFNGLIQSHSILQKKPTTFHFQGERAVLIEADRLHLETAFHNIIDNAVKYANGSVEIHVDIREDDDHCSIRIRDNGKGIPPQYIKSIFDKFFRVPQGDAQAVKGFGLGLYYVNSIIKKHSGTISVQSKPGSGTEFTINLPKNL
jgi:signal transduction histidine kinase